MKYTAIVVTILGLLLLGSLQAQTVPPYISYQGKVTDSNGNGLGTGTPVNRKIIFRIYDGATAGTKLWTEEQTVSISGGEFSVLLGLGIPATGSAAGEVRPAIDTVFTSAGIDRFMGLTVDNGDGTINASDAEITPRQRITSTAYSFRARSADTIASGTDLQLNNSADYGLGYYGAGAPTGHTVFGGITVNGPVLYGQSGGALGVVNGATRTIALQWDASGVLSGNGSGLANLDATKITGTLADARLSGNVALRSGGNRVFAKMAIWSDFEVGGNLELRQEVASWGTQTKFNDYRYLSTSFAGIVEDGNFKAFNVGPGGVGIGYNPPLYGASNALLVNGWVGIGTTTPQKKLQVHDGALLISNDLDTSIYFTRNGTAEIGLTPDVPARLLLKCAGGVSVTSGGLAVAGTITSTDALDATTYVHAGGSRGAGTGHAQGAWLEWNRPGFSGGTCILNHRGLGPGGIIMGNINDADQVTEIMRLTNDGRVGIGTDIPGVKLDVYGDTTVTMTDNGYAGTYSTSGTTATDNSTTLAAGGGFEIYGMSGAVNVPTNIDYFTAPVGIRATGWIASSKGLLIYSDRRIKRDIETSAPANDLAAIQQLRVVDYRMVDPANGGAKSRKGFIAQEVEKVIPGAITRSVEFVPEIFTAATATVFDASTKNLTVTLAKDHGLKAGDRVRLHMDGKRADLDVSSILSGQRFIVNECDHEPNKVFVYGKQVTDFRTVDYDRVFTTAIGALQELSNEKNAEVKALKGENAELRAKLAEQDKRLAALEAQDKARDAKLVAIEKLLLTAEEKPAARTVSLKTGRGAE